MSYDDLFVRTNYELISKKIALDPKPSAAIVLSSTLEIRSQVRTLSPRLLESKSQKEFLVFLIFQ